MKIIKYIFLLVLLLLIAFIVFVATQNSNYTVKREKLVDVPKQLLYNYINDYTNWSDINVLTVIDESAEYEYPDTEESMGKGAVLQWKSDDKEGRIQTVKAIPYDTIIQHAYTDNNVYDVTWIFKDTLNSTKINIEVKGKLSFTEKAYAILNGGITEEAENAVENGLSGLDGNLTEQIKDYTITVQGKAVKRGTYYLGYPAKGLIGNVSEKAGTIVPKLNKFITTNNIAVNGSPFILYNTYNTETDSTSYMVCMPIKDEIITSDDSEFIGKKLEAFPAVKTTLKGSHKYINSAWLASEKYMKEKELTPTYSGSFIVVYNQYKSTTKKQSEWITDIYIPIDKPTDINDNSTSETDSLQKTNAKSKADIKNIKVRQLDTTYVRDDRTNNISGSDRYKPY